MQRSIIVWVLLAAVFSFAGSASAATVDTRQASKYRERVAKLRVKVDKAKGRDAGGRDILKYGIERPGRDRPARHNEVVDYAATLDRILNPPTRKPPYVNEGRPYVPRDPVASSPTPSASAAPSSGGGCYGLPDYIVQRESGGDHSAVSPDGQYHGCAQIDMDLHFGPGGDCVGLSYGGCVQELMSQGIARHWPNTSR